MSRCLELCTEEICDGCPAIVSTSNGRDIPPSEECPIDFEPAFAFHDSNTTSVVCKSREIAEKNIEGME